MKHPKQLLIKNIFSNWAAIAVTMVIALFLSPFLVHTLGKERYGVWALVLSIITFVDLMDVGMKQSLSRFLPKYYATNDIDKVNRVLNSSTFIYSITGTVLLIIIIIISPRMK